MLALIATCKGSSSDTGAGAGGSPPVVYDNSYMAGDWLGSIEPNNQKEPYLFYLRCLADGFPYAGADARENDWNDSDYTTFTWVRPSGAFTVSVIRGDALVLFEGVMTLGGLVIEGRYLQVLGGNLSGGGDFSAVPSGGPGTFVQGDQLPGSWRGELSTLDGILVPIQLEVDSLDRIISGHIDGNQFDLSGWPGGIPIFYEIDSVGRTSSLTVSVMDGSTLQVPFMLVDEDGALVSGKAEHSVLGKVTFNLLND